MDLERGAGVFLHLTSLPGSHGVGDLGVGVRSALRFLDRADASFWQFCPLGPTSGVHGHSPYSSTSTFAGNPLLIDLSALREWGLLTGAELDPTTAFDADAVDYERVVQFTEERLATAFDRFDAGDGGPTDPHRTFEEFRVAESEWLEDYALFAALKTEFDGDPWTDWPDDLAAREPGAVSTYRESLSERVRYHAFVQWVFDEQWRAFRADATDRGISLVGDVPIYVAMDSADVWANRTAFDLAGEEPNAVAGVPPNPGDDGQRWGTPVYDWDRLAEEGYGWWLDRFDRLFDLVDVARLDHFKAFDEYWAIPADARDPAAGEWRPGPGGEFFEAVEGELGGLPFIAEDLGFLDESMIALRDRFAFPGMRVPQYADWCAEHHRYKPVDYPEHCVAYTSTHDTDTAVGYYRNLESEQRDCLEYALATDGEGIAWDLIDAVWTSNAALAITTLPDLLERGSEARLNTPGTATGNWRWRVRREDLSDDLADRLGALTAATLR